MINRAIKSFGATFFGASNQPRARSIWPVVLPAIGVIMMGAAIIAFHLPDAIRAAAIDAVYQSHLEAADQIQIAKAIEPYLAIADRKSGIVVAITSTVMLAMVILLLVIAGQMAHRTRKSKMAMADLRRQNEILHEHEKEMRERNRHFDAALSNMAQGLCMFDDDLRLVACNQHYRDFFKLPEHIAKPGTSLREMITYSVSVGRHPDQTVDELMAQRLAIIDKGKAATLKSVVDGAHTIEIVYRPMAGGGWVATYEDITDRERAEEALAEQNRRFDAALNNMPHGLGMFDAEQRLIVCNRQFAEMYRFPESLTQPGTRLDQIIEYRVATGQGPLDLEAFQRDLKKHTTSGEATNYKLRLRDGRTILINVEPMLTGGWVTTHQDITARERAEEELAQQNRRFDVALNNMYHGLCMFDADKRLIVCNRRYAEMYHLPEELQQPGTTLDEIFDYRVATRQGPLDLESYRRDQLKRIHEGKSISYKLSVEDGRILQVDSEHMAGGGWVATHQDITEATRVEAQINHLARHDALTNLPNRVVFRSNLEEALKRVTRGDAVAVLCLDLDQFKAVNDTLGHPVGDALLQEVADRLRECVRETDTAARLGGDEFAIILTAGDQPAGAISLASRVIESLSAPYTIAGHKVIIGTSVGIAVAPEDGTSPDQLLKNADLALYRAKSDGRGVYRFFEPGMDAKVQARRTMELDLRKALENDEFELFYQPLVNLSAREIVSFEALLRWRHPDRGLIAPLEFIPLAEEIGLINPIGAWVLTQACAQAMKWPSHIGVSVNLSPVQFKTNTLVLNVVSALAASGLPPSRLELEITETVMLYDTEATLATLVRLRELGVSISMDDFGTGYSSLSYLRKFPFDKIKIDQSFVRGLSGEEESAAIVRAVTGLGRSLGMTTTAEGVETADQLEMLQREGCVEVQGFLFSKPVPSSEISTLLERVNKSLKAA